MDFGGKHRSLYTIQEDFWGALPKTHNQHYKSELREILQDKWLAFFNNVKVTKDKA